MYQVYTKKCVWNFFISVQFPYADSCLNRQLADWNGSLMVSDESISVIINKFQNTRSADSQNCFFQEYLPVLISPSDGGLQLFSAEHNQCFTKRGFLLNDSLNRLFCVRTV